ncbi:MAG: DUF3859 domain-containing protein [Moorea sp. SIO2B7]|nr:DUF3859 domain-containing protein [Moorena sp. SIO2B7]
MTEKITPEQINQIVAEINRLANQKETEIDRQQLEEILKELNLPVELLDEALLAFKKRKSKARKSKRIMLAITCLIFVSVALISTMTIFYQKRQQALGEMTAIKNRITLEEDNGGDLTIINRQDTPRLHFRVTLENTPVGKPLALGCDWINPSGKIVHQNRYKTRPVEKEIWHTRCRYRIGAASEAGKWNVQMFSGDRLLASDTFTVK